MPVHQQRIAVLHIIWSLDVGGAERLLLDLVRHSDGARFRHAVCCLGGYGSLRPEFEREGCEVRAFGPTPARGTLGALVRLAAVVRARRPSILHIHRNGPDVWGQLVALLGGARRVVATEHGLYASGDYGAEPSVSPAKTRLRRLLSRRTGMTIAISEAVRREMIAYQLAAPATAVVIHNGVDEMRFAPAERSPVAGRMVVGGVGRLIPRKGFDVLVAAAAVLRKRFSQARFAVAGYGPEEAHLRQLLAREGLSASFELRGATSEVPAFLRTLDVFVAPSREEGFGISVVEAMSCGLPVVASDVGGIPDIIQSGRNGLLVEKENPAALAAAVGRILDEPAFARQLGAAARRTVVERFTIGEMVRRYEAVYADLLSDGEPGRRPLATTPLGP